MTASLLCYGHGPIGPVSSALGTAGASSTPDRHNPNHQCDSDKKHKHSVAITKPLSSLAVYQNLCLSWVLVPCQPSDPCIAGSQPVKQQQPPCSSCSLQEHTVCPGSSPELICLPSPASSSQVAPQPSTVVSNQALIASSQSSLLLLPWLL